MSDDLVKMLCCEITGNQWGTDTRPIGRPCLCPRCQAAAELTRSRERNAELEKERDAAQGTANDIYAKLISDRARIASLEAELDLANKQIAETGRAWTADRARLYATVREMREALTPMAEAGKKLRKIIGDEDISDWYMNYRGFKVADFDAAARISASSESAVGNSAVGNSAVGNSEGEKDVAI